MSRVVVCQRKDQPGLFYEFNEWEFYDLEKDPDELTNLYKDPVQAATIEEIKGGLAELRTAYEDNSDVLDKP